MEESPDLEETWAKIFRSAQKRGNIDTARIYGPHHVFGWQDAWDPDTFFTPKPKWITINCLSKQEGPFKLLRNEVVNILSRDHPQILVQGDHIDMTTTICKRPHYLLAQAEGKKEPTLEDAVTMGLIPVVNELRSLIPVSSKFKEALGDLMAIDMHIESLRKDDPTLPNFQEFIEDLKGNI
jgi:hypothetical protein